MEKFLLLPLVAGLFLTGCGDDSSKKTASATNAPAKYDTGNPVTAVPDYVGAVVQAKNHAEKVIDVSYINEDIQMFNASEGRYPKDLQELIPNYLGKMPAVPYGYKLVYDANTHTAQVVKQ
jgi:hypothetical protein